MAYSKRIYESSPLNRILTQGSPGTTWQPAHASISGSGHTLNFEYSLNKSNQVRLWRVGDSIVSTEYYVAGELQKKVTEDENKNTQGTGRIKAVSYTHLCPVMCYGGKHHLFKLLTGIGL